MRVLYIFSIAFAHLLQSTMSAYIQIDSGTCEENGYHTIFDREKCVSAAASFDIFNEALPFMPTKRYASTANCAIGFVCPYLVGRMKVSDSFKTPLGYLHSPMRVSSSEFVFGEVEGDLLKMVSIDANGNLLKAKWIHEAGLTLAHLTPEKWSSAETLSNDPCTTLDYCAGDFSLTRDDLANFDSIPRGCYAYRGENFANINYDVHSNKKCGWIERDRIGICLCSTEPSPMYKYITSGHCENQYDYILDIDECRLAGTIAMKEYCSTRKCNLYQKFDDETYKPTSSSWYSNTDYIRSSVPLGCHFYTYNNLNSLYVNRMEPFSGASSNRFTICKLRECPPGTYRSNGYCINENTCKMTGKTIKMVKKFTRARRYHINNFIGNLRTIVGTASSGVTVVGTASSELNVEQDAENCFKSCISGSDQDPNIDTYNKANFWSDYSVDDIKMFQISLDTSKKGRCYCSTQDPLYGTGTNYYEDSSFNYVYRINDYAECVPLECFAGSYKVEPSQIETDIFEGTTNCKEGEICQSISAKFVDNVGTEYERSNPKRTTINADEYINVVAAEMTQQTPIFKTAYPANDCFDLSYHDTEQIHIYASQDEKNLCIGSGTDVDDSGKPAALIATLEDGVYSLSNVYVHNQEANKANLGQFKIEWESNDVWKTCNTISATDSNKDKIFVPCSVTSRNPITRVRIQKTSFGANLNLREVKIYRPVIKPVLFFGKTIGSYTKMMVTDLCGKFMYHTYTGSHISVAQMDWLYWKQSSTKYPYVAGLDGTYSREYNTYWLKDFECNDPAACPGCDNIKKVKPPVCKPCPPGTFMDHVSHSFPQCKPCPTGYYSDTIGSIECKKCSEGFSSSENPMQCDSCDIGYGWDKDAKSSLVSDKTMYKMLPTGKCTDEKGWQSVTSATECMKALQELKQIPFQPVEPEITIKLINDMRLTNIFGFCTIAMYNADGDRIHHIPGTSSYSNLATTNFFARSSAGWNLDYWEETYGPDNPFVGVNDRCILITADSSGISWYKVSISEWPSRIEIHGEPGYTMKYHMNRVNLEISIGSETKTYHKASNLRLVSKDVKCATNSGPVGNGKLYASAEECMADAEEDYQFIYWSPVHQRCFAEGAGDGCYTPYFKVFDGECKGRQLRMFEGNGDNPGSSEQRIAACAHACQDKKTPVGYHAYGWSGFHLRGVMVDTSNGRCYCEEQPSTCKDQNSIYANQYDRYDWRYEPIFNIYNKYENINYDQWQTTFYIDHKEVGGKTSTHEYSCTNSDGHYCQGISSLFGISEQELQKKCSENPACKSYSYHVKNQYGKLCSFSYEASLIINQQMKICTKGTRLPPHCSLNSLGSVDKLPNKNVHSLPVFGPADSTAECGDGNFNCVCKKTSHSNYEVIYSENCHQKGLHDIKSADECKIAVMDLDILKSMDIIELTDKDLPNGCISTLSFQPYFNTNGTRTCSTKDKCICAKNNNHAKVEYKLKNEGTCDDTPAWFTIKDAPTCSKALTELNIDATPTDDIATYYVRDAKNKYCGPSSRDGMELFRGKLTKQGCMDKCTEFGPICKFLVISSCTHTCLLYSKCDELLTSSCSLSDVYAKQTVAPNSKKPVLVAEKHCFDAAGNEQVGFEMSAMSIHWYKDNGKFASDPYENPSRWYEIVENCRAACLSGGERSATQYQHALWEKMPMEPNAFVVGALSSEWPGRCFCQGHRANRNDCDRTSYWTYNLVPANENYYIREDGSCELDGSKLDSEEECLYAANLLGIIHSDAIPSKTISSGAVAHGCTMSINDEELVYNEYPSDSEFSSVQLGICKKLSKPQGCSISPISVNGYKSAGIEHIFKQVKRESTFKDQPELAPADCHSQECVCKGYPDHGYIFRDQGTCSDINGYKNIENSAECKHASELLGISKTTYTLYETGIICGSAYGTKSTINECKVACDEDESCKYISTKSGSCHLHADCLVHSFDSSWNVYRKDSLLNLRSPWQQIGNDIRGVNTGDQAGMNTKMSSDGTTVIVGAPENDGGGSASGSVSVYSMYTYQSLSTGSCIDLNNGEIVTTRYECRKMLHYFSDSDDQIDIVDSAVPPGCIHTSSSSVQFNERLESSVSCSETYPCLCKIKSPTWQRIGQPLYGTYTAELGWSVGISADGMAIVAGGWGHDYNSYSNAGIVYAADLRGGEWVKRPTLQGGSTNGYFGGGIDISGDGKTIVVGEYGHISKVYVYRYIEARYWTSLGSFSNQAGSGAGYRVSLSHDGNIMAYSAYHNDVRKTDDGLVRVYEYSGSGSNWNQLGSDIVGIRQNDEIGIGLDLSADGSTLAVGAWYHDVFPNENAGSNVGQVKIFQFNKEVTYKYAGPGYCTDQYDKFSKSYHMNGEKYCADECNKKSDCNGFAYFDGTDSPAVADRQCLFSKTYCQTRNVDEDNWQGWSKVESGDWRQIGQNIDGKVENHYLGYTVALSENGRMLVIGDRYGPTSVDNDRNGGAFIYEYTNKYKCPEGFDFLHGICSRIVHKYNNFKCTDGIADPEHIKSIGISSYPQTYQECAALCSSYYRDHYLHEDVRQTVIDTLMQPYAVSHFASNKDSGSGQKCFCHRVDVGARCEHAKNDYGQWVHDDHNDYSIVKIESVRPYSWHWHFHDYIHGRLYGDQAGYSVSISGDGYTVSIGSLYNDYGGSNAGHVRVFSFAKEKCQMSPQSLGASAVVSDDICQVSMSEYECKSYYDHRLKNSNFDGDFIKVSQQDAASGFIPFGCSQSNSAVLWNEHKSSNQCKFDKKYRKNNYQLHKDVDVHFTSTARGADKVMKATTIDKALDEWDDKTVAMEWDKLTNTATLRKMDKSQTFMKTCPNKNIDYYGCISGGDQNVRMVDVPTTVEGAESCFEQCLDKGYRFAGFECPHQGGSQKEVHCQCYTNSVGDWTYTDDGCGDHAKVQDHCVGPFKAGRYNFGGYGKGSVYDLTLWKPESTWNDCVELNHINSYHVQGERRPGYLERVGSRIHGMTSPDSFGNSVSISKDGSVIAVGAARRSSDKGEVYMYKLEDDQWRPYGASIPGSSNGDKFGTFVALSDDGNTVAVGVPNSDQNGADAGSVSIYRYNEETTHWDRLGSELKGESSGDLFGAAVALSGDGNVVVMGAIRDDAAGGNAGHVRVFRYQPAMYKWKDHGFCSNENDWLPVLTKDECFYGAKYLGYTGGAAQTGQQARGCYLYPAHNGLYVREYNHASTVACSTSRRCLCKRKSPVCPAGAFCNWEQIGNDIDGDKGPDQSGISVDISSDGKTIALGAANSDANSASYHYRGRVRVYKFENFVWTKHGGDMYGAGKEHFLGYRISLSGDGLTVAAGALGSTDGKNRNGYIRVWRTSTKYSKANWFQISSDIHGEDDNDSFFFPSLNYDGSILAVGAFEAGSSFRGKAYLYKYISWHDLGVVRRLGEYYKIGEVLGSASNNFYGRSVAITQDGHRFVAGAAYRTDKTDYSTKGYVDVWDFHEPVAWLNPAQNYEIVTENYCTTSTYMKHAFEYIEEREECRIYARANGWAWKGSVSSSAWQRGCIFDSGQGVLFNSYASTRTCEQGFGARWACICKKPANPKITYTKIEGLDDTDEITNCICPAMCSKKSNFDVDIANRVKGCHIDPTGHPTMNIHETGSGSCDDVGGCICKPDVTEIPKKHTYKMLKMGESVTCGEGWEPISTETQRKEAIEIFGGYTYYPEHQIDQYGVARGHKDCDTKELDDALDELQELNDYYALDWTSTTKQACFYEKPKKYVVRSTGTRTSGGHKNSDCTNAVVQNGYRKQSTNHFEGGWPQTVTNTQWPHGCLYNIVTDTIYWNAIAPNSVACDSVENMICFEELDTFSPLIQKDHWFTHVSDSWKVISNGKCEDEDGWTYVGNDWLCSNQARKWFKNYFETADWNNQKSTSAGYELPGTKICKWRIGVRGSGNRRAPRFVYGSIDETFTIGACTTMGDFGASCSSSGGVRTIRDSENNIVGYGTCCSETNTIEYQELIECANDINENSYEIISSADKPKGCFVDPSTDKFTYNSDEQGSECGQDGTLCLCFRVQTATMVPYEPQKRNTAVKHNFCVKKDTGSCKRCENSFNNVISPHDTSTGSCSGGSCPKGYGVSGTATDEWTQVGDGYLPGMAESGSSSSSIAKEGYSVALSGDGSIFATADPFVQYQPNINNYNGAVRVFKNLGAPEYKLKTSGRCTDELGWQYIFKTEECAKACLSNKDLTYSMWLDFCTNEIVSPNSPVITNRGCDGARYSDGSHSKQYCDGNTGSSTHNTYYSQCCSWNGKECQKKSFCNLLRTETTTTSPPGCYKKTDVSTGDRGTLFNNHYVDSSVECSEERPCICKRDNGYKQLGQTLMERNIVEFGRKVILSKDGHRIAISSLRDSQKAGAVFVYQYQESTDKWIQLGKKLEGDNNADYFGVRIAFSESGHRLSIVSSNFQDDTKGSDIGYVRVFDLLGDEPYKWKIDGIGNCNTDLGWTKIESREECSEAGKYLGFTRLPDLNAHKNYGSEPSGCMTSIYHLDSQMDYNENINDISCGQLEGKGHRTCICKAEWIQVGQDIVARSSHSSHRIVSTSLDSSGTLMAVGMIGVKSTDGEYQKGLVELYKFDGSKWSRGAVVHDDWSLFYTTSNQFYQGANFGQSVILSGDGKKMAVSAPHHDSMNDPYYGDLGRIYIFNVNDWRSDVSLMDSVDGDVYNGYMGTLDTLAFSRDGSTFVAQMAKGSDYKWASLEPEGIRMLTFTIDEDAEFSEHTGDECSMHITEKECKMVALNGIKQHFDIPFVGHIEDQNKPYGCIMSEDRTKIFFNRYKAELKELWANPTKHTSHSDDRLKGDGCKNNDCGECQGDCDSHSDCIGDLLCYQASGVQEVPPGCKHNSRGHLLFPGFDFCFNAKAHSCLWNHCICRSNGNIKRMKSEIKMNSDTNGVRSLALSDSGSIVIVGDMTTLNQREQLSTAATGSISIYSRTGNIGSSENCQKCGPATYSDSDTIGQCEQVPDGFTVVTENGLNVGITKCPLGTFGAGCTPCPINKFGDVLGLSVCKTCAAGKYNNVTGETKCYDCEIGTYGVGCKDCPAGKYGDVPAAVICKNCPNGFYQDQEAKDRCKQHVCPPATQLIAIMPTDSSDTSSICEECPEGKAKSDESAEACEECPEGKFVNAEKTECITCYRDSYFENGVCKLCTNSYGTKDDPTVCDSPLVEYNVQLVDNTQLYLHMEAANVEQIIVKFGDKTPTNDEPHRFQCDCQKNCTKILNRTVPDMALNNFLDHTGIVYIACVDKQLPIFLPVVMPISYRTAETKGTNDFTALTCQAAEDTLGIHTIFANDTCKTVEGNEYIRSVSPSLCENVNGLVVNDVGCKCGNTACEANSFCFSKYSTCQDNTITYVPTRDSSSDGCNAENEKPIVNQQTCSLAATQIGLYDQTAEQWVKEENSPKNCFYDHADEGNGLFFNADGTDNDLEHLDVLICRYQRCSCTGGIPQSGCSNPAEQKCTKCHTGRVLNDKFECEPLTACEPGSEPAEDYQTSKTCLACQTGKFSIGGLLCKKHKEKCDPGYEITQQGTDKTDAVCTICQPGMFSEDGSPCQFYENCDYSTQFQASEPSIDKNRDCQDIKECSETEFQVSEPTSNSNRVCQAIKDCSNSQFQVSEPTQDSDRVCQTIKECSETEFEVSEPTPDSDRVCQTIKICQSTEHETQAPTTISNRICEPNVCTCPNGTASVQCLSHQSISCQSCDVNYGYNDITKQCELCESPQKFNNEDNLSPCQISGACPKGKYYTAPASFGEVEIQVDIKEDPSNPGQNKYEFDGQIGPILTFKRGRTYVFKNIPDAHPLKFSTSPDGIHGSGQEYTDYTIEGQDVKIEITINTPNPLYYYCELHAGMGNSISVEDQISTETCTSCDDGKYQDADNHYQVKCKEHSPACDPLSEHQTVEATVETDRICATNKECSPEEYESKAPTENSDRECTEITICNEDQFVSQSAGSKSNTQCSNITECNEDQYEVSPPDETTNRVCADITQCEEDQYEISPPDEFNDRVCGSSAECSSNQYESQAPTDNSPRVCTQLRECTSEEYESKAPTTNTDRECSEITFCNEGQFVSQSATPTSNTQCSNITECNENQFQVSPPNPTTDRVCQTIKNCTSQQYQTAEPTETNDRECEALLQCSSEEYESKAPTETSDRECTLLKTCTPTEYESKAPTENSNRECTTLTVCTSTQYESSPPADGIYYIDRICVQKSECDDNSKYKSGTNPDGSIICETKICTCENGVGAQGQNCDTHQQHICAECSDNFFVDINRKCAPVKQCLDNEYESKAPTTNSNRECTPVKQCLDNEYESKASTATTDKECTPVKQCLDNEYESKAPTETSDRECTTVKQCLDNEYESKAPTETSDRECTTIRQCSSEEYESKAPTTNSNRECTTLTICGEGFYEPGGVKDEYFEDRKCVELTTCGEDKYKVGTNEQGDVCETKVCTCLHGTAATGSLCPVHLSAKCISCPDTHYLNFGSCQLATVCSEIQHVKTEKTLTTDRVCENNVCTCKDGNPQSPCLVHLDDTCTACAFGRFLNADKKCQIWSTCDRGYHPIGGSGTQDITCEENLCLCNTGLPARGVECPENGKVKCGSCPLGTFMASSGNRCIPYKCTCPNGEPAKGQLCTSNSVRCKSCKYPFTLIGVDCVNCNCLNGYNTDTCTKNGPKCASCKFGYTLKDDKCVKNTCFCNNGQRADLCLPGEESCKSCYNNYELTEKKCIAKNVRGDVIYSFFVDENSFKNSSEIQLIIATATGFKVQSTSGKMTSQGYRYEMVSIDDPKQETGAFKTIRETIGTLPGITLSRIRTSEDKDSSGNTNIIIIGSVVGALIVLTGISFYYCKIVNSYKKGFKRIPNTEL